MTKWYDYLQSQSLDVCIHAKEYGQGGYGSCWVCRKCGQIGCDNLGSYDTSIINASQKKGLIMNQLDLVTSKVCNTIHDDGSGQAKVFVDPATIMMATTIIINLVKLIKECKTAREAKAAADTPTRFEQRVVYRQIKKQLPWRDYFNYSKQNKIAQAIFQTGSNMTEQDMEQLFQEIED